MLLWTWFRLVAMGLLCVFLVQVSPDGESLFFVSTKQTNEKKWTVQFTIIGNTIGNL